NTTTVVSSITNPTVFGQDAGLRAVVSAVAPGAGTPTGNVNFFDNGNPIAGCQGTILVTFSGQQIAGCVPTTPLSVGTHQITAVYQGDTNFNTSTSVQYAQVVNKANTTTTVTSSQNPSAFGQNVTFTATLAAVTPGSGTPTG